MAIAAIGLTTVTSLTTQALITREAWSKSELTSSHGSCGLRRELGRLLFLGFSLWRCYFTTLDRHEDVMTLSHFFLNSTLISLLVEHFDDRHIGVICRWKGRNYRSPIWPCLSLTTLRKAFLGEIFTWVNEFLCLESLTATCLIHKYWGHWNKVVLNYEFLRINEVERFLIVLQLWWRRVFTARWITPLILNIVYKDWALILMIAAELCRCW